MAIGEGEIELNITILCAVYIFYKEKKNPVLLATVKGFAKLVMWKGLEKARPLQGAK